MTFDLDAALDSARKKASEPETEAALVVVGTETFQIIYTKTDGESWNDFVGEFPPRDGHHGDGEAGYNVDAATKAYTKKRAVMVTPDGETINPTDAQWDGLFAVLDAPDLNSLGVTIWVLNVGRAVMRLNAAGKAWRASTEKAIA